MDKQQINIVKALPIKLVPFYCFILGKHNGSYIPVAMAKDKREVNSIMSQLNQMYGPDNFMVLNAGEWTKISSPSPLPIRSDSKVSDLMSDSKDTMNRDKSSSASIRASDIVVPPVPDMSNEDAGITITDRKRDESTRRTGRGSGAVQNLPQYLLATQRDDEDEDSDEDSDEDDDDLPASAIPIDTFIGQPKKGDGSVDQKILSQLVQPDRTPFTSRVASIVAEKKRSEIVTEKKKEDELKAVFSNVLKDPTFSSIMGGPPLNEGQMAQVTNMGMNIFTAMFSAAMPTKKSTVVIEEVTSPPTSLPPIKKQDTTPSSPSLPSVEKSDETPSSLPTLPPAPPSTPIVTPISEPTIIDDSVSVVTEELYED